MTSDRPSQPTHLQPCNLCEGKGYTEIRDCAGEIQRTETCSFCEGTGNRDRRDRESTKLY